MATFLKQPAVSQHAFSPGVQWDQSLLFLSPSPRRVLGSLALAAGGGGTLLWMVLFSNWPWVHDTFHTLRHALYTIPCH